jgi:hypothetical protein
MSSNANEQYPEYDDNAFGRILENLVTQKANKRRNTQKDFSIKYLPRDRQINKWGVQLHDDTTWSVVLGRKLVKCVKQYLISCRLVLPTRIKKNYQRASASCGCKPLLVQMS